MLKSINYLILRIYMCDKFEIDDKTRFMVLFLDAHMNAHEIAQIINRSVKTIYDWEAKIRKGEDIRVHKGGNGRKKLITEETENKIIQMLKQNPERATLKKLATSVGHAQSAIHKILAKKGFRYKPFDQSKVYEDEERILRVDFCNQMLYDEGTLIYKTFFSDEMGIELNNARRRAWQSATEKIRKKVVIENIKLECWGAISARGATTLEIYKKGMNGDLFRQVIEGHRVEMEQLYPDGEFYFIQDSLPVHRMNEDWLTQQQNLKLIKLPKRSSDLNIIENLWIALKERVAADAPSSEKELRLSLLNNWALLTKPERLQPFFEGLHRRYMECVAKNGQKLQG